MPGNRRLEKDGYTSVFRLGGGARQGHLQRGAAEQYRYSSDPPLNWHCALCDTDYRGNKYCKNCRSGIYSIEGAVD